MRFSEIFLDSQELDGALSALCTIICNKKVVNHSIVHCYRCAKMRLAPSKMQFAGIALKLDYNQIPAKEPFGIFTKHL